MVVEPNVLAQPTPCLARARILVQIHLLIFDRPPQPFREDVVQRPPLAIPTDRDPCASEQVGVAR